jgi:hypothetical protein
MRSQPPAHGAGELRARNHARDHRAHHPHRRADHRAHLEATVPSPLTTALADLHAATVALGWHDHLRAENTREPALDDINVAVAVCDAALPAAKGRTEREVAITRDVLARIAARSVIRGGVKGHDVLMLRGCFVDLRVMLA